MNTKKGTFIPQDAEEMGYHEYLDYWVCKCKNFEKLDGFNASDRYGNLISPIGAEYCRCERCGSVIEVKSHTIIGINPNPDRGRF
ncbi:hypothetical protein [Pedobacter cryoconitis]|uniref:Uncharacterized protein n=1 Tax=Pedobacter cryoconitis TaxID=188932 RepID=A0A327SGZ9_9SPHI|nr:hypothetical protein [Pedobacter cryoconitis]RAJ28101.1 hypothetical protein LY11_03421 [Pedobacter cryoconitis]